MGWPESASSRASAVRRLRGRLRRPICQGCAVFTSHTPLTLRAGRAPELIRTRRRCCEMRSQWAAPANPSSSRRHLPQRSPCASDVSATALCGPRLHDLKR